MATANACVPLLPEVPEINGIKTASKATLSKVSSNCPIRLAVNIPRNSRTTSHGKRFLAAWNGVTSNLSISEIPANLE